MISNVSPEHDGHPVGDASAAPSPTKAQAKNSSIPASFAGIVPILEKHGRKASRLVPILQEVQEKYRYLPPDVLTYVARSLNIAPARVFGVATFYAHFTIKPKGKHVVRLCDGTACHVKDSVPILDAIRKRLGVNAKAPTTPDLQFTVETVACLGACGLAPVVVIDEQVYGQMTPAKAVAEIEAIITREKEATP